MSYLSPSLRLVVAGRSDPPLPLARLRARSDLTELRAADLRFNRAEAAALPSLPRPRSPDPSAEVSGR